MDYIGLVLRGDSEFFAPLVDKYKQLAFSLALKVTRNREDAEEVAQDAFIKAYRSLEKFKGGSSFKTWFFRIVYTTAISKVRGKKREFISYEDHRLTDQVSAEVVALNKVDFSFQLKPFYPLFQALSRLTFASLTGIMAIGILLIADLFFSRYAGRSS